MMCPRWFALVCCAMWTIGAPGTGAGQERSQQTLLQTGRPASEPIARLISSRCLRCHAGAEPEGGIDLTGPSRIATDTAAPDRLLESRLWEVVRDGDMPPDDALAENEKKIVYDWLVAGAPNGFEPIDPWQFTTDKRAGYDWWSLQPIQQVEIPPAGNERIRGPIDRFVLAKLEGQGLKFSPDAEPRHQMRRLYFDLTGLPAPPEAIKRFEADPSDAAYGQIVGRLLASPEYGERWARHWLDIVRFGESDGFERNAPRPQSWRYRDWVIEALNADMPFDEFARKQIAGDALCKDPVEGMVATGFLVAGVHNTVVGSSKSMQLFARQDEMEDLVGTVGQTFAGLTFNCARCHDHKFDPLTQKEYYQLVAATAGVNHGIRQARPAIDQQRLEEMSLQTVGLRDALTRLEKTAREKVLSGRKQTSDKAAIGPEPRYEWEFALGSQLANNQALELHGDANRSASGLELDGDGDFAQSLPIPFDVAEKTLEAWVRLGNLDQRGGAAISVETLDGSTFDAVVFAEREEKHWMAGSNGFSRTQPFGGVAESIANEPVHIAITYAADGTITAWRNGTVQGLPYRSAELQKFSSGAARILFGLRHSPGSGNRFLSGTIIRARLYDRVLSAEEIAASAGMESSWVDAAELVQHMSPGERDQRTRKLNELELLIAAQKELEAGSLVSAYTAVFSPAGATHFLPRGDAMNPGDEVEPGAPAAIAGLPGAFPKSLAEQDRRVHLANWLTDEANSLFYRVIVNRLWHYHFGRGIIATPSDFGFNGGTPSHPELLDWLAAEFQRNGNRLKPLHRMIVTSTAYRQSSAWDDASWNQDAGNQWLWRKSPTRLDAEVVRDTLLDVSGKLNRQRGGPGYEDVKIIDQNNGTTYYESFDSDDPRTDRRTIYRLAPRGGRSALLDSLDCPDPSAATPRRSVTTTPLQALSLLNNDFVLRISDASAARASAETPEIKLQIQWMFRKTLGRNVSEEELVAAEVLARDHGLAAVARALFNCNEFVIVQ